MSDPLRNFKFQVIVAAFAARIGFSKVSGLSSEVEVIEYREGGDTITTRKFPGQVSYGNVTLERGLTTDSDIVGWMNTIHDAAVGNGSTLATRQEVKIQALNKAGVVQREWVLLNAFPASRDISDFDASSNEVIIETLELAHEGIKEFLYNEIGVARTLA